MHMVMCIGVLVGYECWNLRRQRAVPGAGSCIVDLVGSWFGVYILVIALHVCLFTLTARTHQSALVPAVRRAACAFCDPILCYPCLHACCVLVSVMLSLSVMHAFTDMPSPGSWPMFAGLSVRGALGLPIARSQELVTRCALSGA